MASLKKIMKNLGKILPGTGRHAAKRAQNSANEFAAQSQQERLALQKKTDRERLRAQKLAIRGMRSRRAASHFNPEGERTTYGSPTIG